MNVINENTPKEESGKAKITIESIINNVFKNVLDEFYYINDINDNGNKYYKFLLNAQINPPKKFYHKLNFFFPEDITKYVYTYATTQRGQRKEGDFKPGHFRDGGAFNPCAKILIKGAQVQDNGKLETDVTIRYDDLLEYIKNAPSLCLENTTKKIEESLMYSAKMETDFFNNRAPRGKDYNPNEINRLESRITEDQWRLVYKDLIKHLVTNYNNNFAEYLRKEFEFNFTINENNIIKIIAISLFVAICYYTCSGNDEKHNESRIEIKEKLATICKSIGSDEKRTQTENAHSIIKKDFLPLPERLYIPREDKEKELLVYIQEKRKPICVFGLGGIGKSEFIRAFADKYKEEYNFIFTQFTSDIKNTIRSISVTNEDDLKYEYVNGQKQVKSEDEIYRTKLNILQQQDANTILIIDGFDKDDNALNLCSSIEFKELLEMPILVIFTSRTKFEGIASFYTVEIEELSESQLLKLMQSYENVKSIDEKVLVKMIQLVDRHTLTVDLIAKILNGSGCRKITPEEMVECLENRDYDKYKAIISEYNRNNKKNNILGHLVTLFDISDFSRKQMHVMNCACMMSDLGLDAEMFLNALGDDFEECIDDLLNSSWLKLDSDRNIIMHSLIRTVCKLNSRNGFAVVDKQRFADELVRIRNKEANVDKLFSEEISRQIIAILTKVLKVSKNDALNADICRLISKEYSDVIGNIRKALNYKEREFEIAKELTINAVQYARLCKEIGFLRTKMKQPSESEIPFMFALNAINNVFDANNREIVHEKADIHYKKGLMYASLVTNRGIENASKAIEQFIEASRLFELVFPEMNYTRAEIYVNICSMLILLDRDTEIEPYLSKAENYIKSLPNYKELPLFLNIELLHSYLKTSTFNDMDNFLEKETTTIDTLMDMYPENSLRRIPLYEQQANLLLECEEYEQARIYFEKMIQIHKHTENTFEVYKLNCKIAYSYYEEEDYEEALSYLTKAQEEMEKYDPANIKLLFLKAKKALLATYCNNLQEAINFYKEASAIETMQNDKYSIKKIFLYGQGLCNLMLGKYEDAEELFNAADKCEAGTTPSSPLPRLYEYIGDEYRKIRKYARAHDFYSVALNVYQLDEEKHSTDIFYLYFNIADMHFYEEDYIRSIENLSKCEQILISTGADDNKELLFEVLKYKVIFCVLANKIEDAFKLCGSDAFDVEVSDNIEFDKKLIYFGQGLAYHKQNNLSEAEKYYNKGANIKTEHSDNVLPCLYKAIADEYLNSNDTTNAKSYYLKALDIYNADCDANKSNIEKINKKLSDII